jgi:hypothetical protein
MTGEFTATLTLEDRPIASQSLTLRPGESETVTWQVNPDLPGVYNVTVNQLNDKLDVITVPKALNPKEPVYWWLVAVAGALVIMLIMLVRVGSAPAKVAVGVGAAGGAAYILAADALKEIYIEPDKPTIGVKASIQLRAVGRYYDGSKVDVTQKVEWRSSDPRTAEVVDEKEFRGLVFGHRPGVATIGIKWDNKESSTMIGVNCSVYDPEHPNGPGIIIPTPPVREVGVIMVVPRSEVIDIGGVTRFTATAHYADGTSENVSTKAVWTSTNDFVADIDETGTARGYSAGMTAIIATFRGKRGTATLHVEG